jgi:hypothetical protein
MYLKADLLSGHSPEETEKNQGVGKFLIRNLEWLKHLPCIQRVPA